MSGSAPVVMTKALSPSNHDIMMLWMLLDGVGLAIIASCTVMEGFELWRDFFSEYVEFNVPATIFWVCGRFSQVCGLLLLIAHAASHAIGIMVHELEQCGMLMLSTGPILNLIACSIFDSQADPTFVFNKQWISSECLELFGILLLDLSMMDAADHLVLLEEVVGFFILGCASLIDFDYSQLPIGEGMNRTGQGIFPFIGGIFAGVNYPMITMRLDMIHVADCFGTTHPLHALLHLQSNNPILTLPHAHKRSPLYRQITNHILSYYITPCTLQAC